MNKAQLDRDKAAIRTVLQQLGRATFSEIFLRAGEGLWPAMLSMLYHGEVFRCPFDPTPRYQLEPF
jgi:hypothetical protein